MLIEVGEYLLVYLDLVFEDIVVVLDSFNCFCEMFYGLVWINVLWNVIGFVFVLCFGELVCDYFGIILEVVVDEGFVNIVEVGFDVGICFGEDF